MASDDANKMGLLAAISYIIGSIVGSGVFIVPGIVLAHTQSIGLSSFVWIGCSVIAMIGGITYIELGTAIPKSGGDVVYATFVGWNALAFCLMWIVVTLSIPASTAVLLVTFGEYLVSGISQFIDLGSYREVLQLTSAATLLLCCTVMNCFSLEKIAARFQILFSASKFLILVMVIAVGAHWYFIAVILGETTGLEKPMDNSNYNISTLVLATYAGFWSFMGFDVLNVGGAAVKNPKRVLPFAITGGLLAISLLYIFINFSYCVVLGPQGMMNTTSIASDFSHKALGSYSVVVPFLIAALFLGNVNATVFMNSRVIQQAAHDGYLPKFLSAIHRNSESPRVAVMANFLIVFILMFIELTTLLNSVAFMTFVRTSSSACALLKIRYRKMAVDAGVVRVPLVFPILCLLISIGLLIVPFITQFETTIIGVIYVIPSLLLYFIFIKRSKSRPVPAVFVKSNDFFTKVTSSVFNCDVNALSEKMKPLPRESGDMELK